MSGLQPAGRLTLPQLAYLRAVAEGVPHVDAARRFLGIEHGAEARTAHRLVVEQAAAVARRRGDSRWRLIGLALDRHAEATAAPTMNEWAEAEGLDGWSEAELQAMYVERFGSIDARTRRRMLRDARLRERRLELLRELEAVAVTPAAPTDLIAGWFPPDLAENLRPMGELTLQDLRRRVDRGGRWWVGIKGYGPVRAARLEAYLASLLGSSRPHAWPVLAQAPTKLDGSHGANRAPAAYGGVDAANDRAAIRSWIAARAGSPTTARQYEREAERFLLWMVLERHKALSDASVDDCSAYLAFLADVPDRWVSRRRVGRFEPGWAPFRGSLTVAGRRVALAALHSLFAWLVAAQYLVVNPWALINRKLGDDPDAYIEGDDSRAFSPEAWRVLHEQLDAEGDTPSTARLRLLLAFNEAVGLRPAELLSTTRSRFIHRRKSWFVRVHGKGKKNRLVPVPTVAMRAVRKYFAVRALDFDSADGSVPLVASLASPSAPTYASLHESFTRFVRRAIRGSALDADARRAVEHASLHWLRHTHATRAAEGGVPQDVLQANLGQADPRTTAGYYQAQIDRRVRESERAFPDT